MIKKAALILAALCLTAAVGCTQSAPGPASSAAQVQSGAADNPPSQGGNGDEVQITLPASVLLGQDAQRMVAEAKEQDLGTATANADGSITYTMSRENQKKWLDNLKKGLDSIITELNESDGFASIDHIAGNSDYTEYTVKARRAAYEGGMDSLAIWGLSLPSAHYQLFGGASADELRITFHLQDVETGEEFQTIVYPDDADLLLGAAPAPQS